jgi:hypothetical protein
MFVYCSGNNVGDNDVGTSSEPQQPPFKKLKPEQENKDPFAALRDGVVAASSNTAAANHADIIDELNRYKDMSSCSSSMPVLSFWKKHTSDLPILSHVARRVLCISSSSAQSERDFSSVGRTITDARSQLSANKVESIELLKWGSIAGLL